MSGVSDFVSAQKANRRNTLLLLVLLTALAAVFGYVIGYLLEAEVRDELFAWSLTGGVLAIGLTAASVIWSGVALAFGSRIVLGMADAKPIEKAEAPQLFNVVEEMSIAAGIPVPAVYLLADEPGINAFAAAFTWLTAHACRSAGFPRTASGAKPSKSTSYAGCTATSWPCRCVDNSVICRPCLASRPAMSSQ